MAERPTKPEAPAANRTAPALPTPTPVPPAKSHDPAPVRPDEPAPADCCGEGCSRCVFDVYDEAMERYKAELAQWRARQSPDRSDRSLSPKRTSFGA